jgi:hypothetical protein
MSNFLIILLIVLAFFFAWGVFKFVLVLAIKIGLIILLVGAVAWLIRMLVGNMRSN